MQRGPDVSGTACGRGNNALEWNEDARQVLETMSKYSAKRACPALGRSIAPAECGSQRNTAIDCPFTCPHNPFGEAQHEAFFEDAWQMIYAVVEAFGDPKGGLQPVARMLVEAGRNGESDDEIGAATVLRIFGHRDADGQRWVERWQRTAVRDMTNDRRAMLKALCTLRPRLLQARRVLDRFRVEVVDLMDPGSGPWILMDEDHASEMVRYETVLGLFFVAGGCLRGLEPTVVLPFLNLHEPLSMVAAVARHEAGEEALASLPAWVGDHYLTLTRHFRAIREAEAHAFEGAARSSWCFAEYRFRNSVGAVYDAIHARLDVLPFDDARSEGVGCLGLAWMGERTREQPRGEVLAKLYVGKADLLLDAPSVASLNDLCARLEQALGEFVECTTKQVGDPDPEGTARTREEMESKTIPFFRPVVTPAHAAFFGKVFVGPWVRDAFPREPTPEDVQESLRRILDQPCPLLDDKTLRAAAMDPALRPRVVLLLQRLVIRHDTYHLVRGTVGDIDWFLREAGVPELVLPNLPVRPPIPQYLDEDDDDEGSSSEAWLEDVEEAALRRALGPSGGSLGWLPPEMPR